VQKPFDIHALADVVNNIVQKAEETPRLTLEPEKAEATPGERRGPEAATG
jgi:hypothetical protein